MPTEFAFRVSMYLTLAFSCLCLGYAEWELLPEVTGFMAVVLVMLAVSFRYEGRIELSLSRANLLGLIIAILGVGWMAKKLSSPATGLMANLSWPTNILPFAGPMLMVLIPAKLFRPKHVGDWWAMQGVGLTAVGLAAALSDDVLFVVLMSVYLFFAVLSLTLFYYRRSGGFVTPLPTTTPLPRPSVVFAQSVLESSEAPPYQFAVGRSLRWIVYAVAVAVPLFFVSPRSGAPLWGLSSSKVSVGYNPEPTLEMNRTGDLQTSREVACEVSAKWPDGRPHDELDPLTYWYGRSYRGYDAGRWNSGIVQGGSLVPPPKGRPTGRLLDLWTQAGRKPFLLELLPRTRTAVVHLSPAGWELDAESPIVTASENQPERPWPLFPEGQYRSPTMGRDLIRQVAVAPLEPGLAPGFPLPPPADYAAWVFTLTAPSRIPEGIRKLAERLIRRWVADKTLPSDTFADGDRPGECRVSAHRREVVASVFRDHLAFSGGYTYSTKLRRQDPKRDPIEDFLLNGKIGHCQWFAAGYALLLRSVGVPCQFVLGFRGQENLGEGRYEILQEHAHAWAEVLIERNTAGTTTLHWMTVDPTTSGEASSDASWWSNTRQKSVDFIADYILGYSPERRQEAIRDARVFAEKWWPIAAGLVLFAVVWRTRRRWWPSRPSAAPHPLITTETPPWFLEYLSAIDRLGLLPSTGQTPKEFAEVVASTLRVTPAGAGVAEVPAFVTSKFYRVRYGGSALTGAEDAEVRAAVDRLRAVVQELSVLVPAPTQLAGL